MPYDEFWKAPGVPREHQAELMKYLQSAGPERGAALERAVTARILEQEISFNILGDPDGTTRPWHLDAWPLVMNEQEFGIVSGGMQQRAHLLGELLDDIYGPQRFLAEGLIPSELVFGNPRYFRTVAGLKPLGGHRITLYAADVARTATGVFQVYSDRTAAPTGSGYALENRLVLGQVHSELFRSYRVQKINSFFALVHAALKSLRSNRQTAPRIVLLTPGLQDESSFEHAYLARYLGLDLVEGRDLTVRGDEVFFKTLEGLKKVDVILRRMGDDWCDPLELREDSILGVSGLVAAARAGTVGIVNPLGSGVVEAPAFKAYLDGLQLALHGQPLILPNVPCRWLGDPKHREDVFSSLDQWIFKPAFQERTEAVIVASGLNQSEKVALQKRILSNPQRYVAEQWSERSLSPLSYQTSQMAPMSIRLFACRSGNDYHVMPGGLVRLNDNPDGIFLASSTSSTSKDLWIPSKSSTEPPQLPAMPVQPLVLRRGGVDLPSRLFDDIFWLGRYVERCDNAARLVRAGLEPMITEGSELPRDLADSLAQTIHSLEIVGPVVGAPRPKLERLLMTAVYDLSKPNSIRSALERIRSLTSAVRSRLSRDAWDALRRLSQVLDSRSSSPPTVNQALQDVQELIIVLAAVHGIFGSNMVRGHAWMFVEMGRRIEHGVFLLTLIQHMFPKDSSHLKMATLLNICDSTLTYRSRYLSTFQPAPVADLILTDASNPSSVLFQVRQLLHCVRLLPGEPRFPLSRAEQRLVVIETHLVTADLEKACEEKAEGLRALAEECTNLFWQVSDDLARTYFSHAGLAHAVKPSVWVDENLEAR